MVIWTGYCCPTALNLCPLPSPQGENSTDFIKQHPFWYQKGKLKVLLLAVGIWWVWPLCILPDYLLNEKTATRLLQSHGELHQSMFKFFVNGRCWFFFLLKHSFYGTCLFCYSPEKLEAGVSMQPGYGVAYLHKAIASKWRFQVRQMCIDYSDLYLCQTLYLYMPYI